jgi:hypothetical protein
VLPIAFESAYPTVARALAAMVEGKDRGVADDAPTREAVTRELHQIVSNKECQCAICAFD